jgi:multidrug resistance efflux pump
MAIDPMPSVSPPTADQHPLPVDPPPKRSSRANALVIGLGSGLLLAALGVVMVVLTTRSRDAVVDADFIELASPISGQLMDLTVEVGEAVRRDERLALVENPRASDGDVHQLRTALTTAQAKLEQVERELALQRRLAKEFHQDAGDQRRLETARTSNELDQLRADLARERQELAFSERNLKRQIELFQAGAVAANVVDRARTTMEATRQLVVATEAKIRAQTNRVQAADRNLNLDRTRGDTDPLPRLQEVRLTLAQLEGEQVALQRRVAGLQAQLKTAESLFRKQSSVWMEAPVASVVWQVQARRGDSLRPQQPLLRLVNCSSRWISTYVSEGDLRRLRIGSRARIDLIGEELDLRGQVDLIRSGVGRLSDQNDDSARLPINLARESEVRVRIDQDVPAPPRKLCFVGYSARVIFQ